MATLSTIRTDLALRLRDTSNTTWSTDELDELINQGIDALADIYPKEIVQTVGTVAAGVYSYDASDFKRIFRIDLYTDAGSYATEIPHGFADANSGWEFHGGVLYLPPSYTYPADYTLRAWGYSRYIELVAASTTTDLDLAGIFAVKVFAEAEAYELLMIDRAKFQQWQQNSNASDVTALQMLQLAGVARQRWRREQQRLRRLRR